MSIPYSSPKDNVDCTSPDPIEIVATKSPKDRVEEAMNRLTEQYASNFAKDEEEMYKAIAKTRLAGEDWCSSDFSWLRKISLAEAKYVAGRLNKLGYKTRITTTHTYGSQSWSVHVRNPDKTTCCVQ